MFSVQHTWWFKSSTPVYSVPDIEKKASEKIIRISCVNISQSVFILKYSIAVYKCQPQFDKAYCIYFFHLTSQS